MKNMIKLPTANLVLAMITGSALAHDGRRFDIQVKDGQLVAQGYISGNNPTDDGNGVVRDYYNAIHAHWSTDPTNRFSSTDLPGCDIEGETALLQDELWLEVLGVKKWSNAPFADFAGGGHHGSGHHSGTVHPHFMPITTGESITVSYSSTVLTPGSPFQLSDAIGLSGHFDLNFDYIPSDLSTFELAPTDAVYLVELQLSTSDSTIAPSDTIHAIISPKISGAHALSLAIEEALGTPVPEPSSLGLLGLGGLLLVRRRRG